MSFVRCACRPADRRSRRILKIGQSCAVSVGNAGYFILHNLGFTHEEINKMLDAAQKTRYADVFERQERKRKGRRASEKKESSTEDAQKVPRDRSRRIAGSPKCRAARLAVVPAGASPVSRGVQPLL